MWLLVRVTMQLGFSRAAILTKTSKNLYKAFMAFLMAYILEMSHSLKYFLRNDILSAMNAKLSRRLLKLGAEQVDNPWIDVVRHVMSLTHRLIETRWQDISDQAHPNLNLLRLKLLRFKDDVIIDLPDLNDHIVDMTRRKRITSQSTFNPTTALSEYLPDVLPQSLGSFTGDCQTFNLAAFESWVNAYLPSWLSLHLHDELACEQLWNLIEDYHGYAASHYTNNPESLSIMFLTIIEPWIACDKSACIHHDLLLDYNAGIPVELLQCLVLPFNYQMERLLQAELYIKSRQDNAKVSSPSIFHSFGHSSAFSVRYFDKSPEHQALLCTIEGWASRLKEDKRKELSQKKEEYRNLMRLYDQSVCEFYEVIVNEFDGFSETRHSRSCKKCRHKNQANSISIEIHEWPLSSKLLEAKSTVFELIVPAAFGGWRDATLFLLNDVFACKHSDEHHPQVRYTLQNDRSRGSLSSFFTHTRLRTQRVGLLSSTKPHTATHRQNKAIVNEGR